MSANNESLTKTLNEIAVAQERNETAREAWQRKHDERMDVIVDRVEALESNSTAPSNPGSSRNVATKEAQEHAECFTAWMRRPHDHATKAALAEAETEISKKAVTIGTPSAGGYAVPEMISADIERRVAMLNPFRQLVTVRSIGTSSWNELVDMGDGESGWVGEGDTRNETGTPALRNRVPTMGTNYALPKVSEEALQDIFFDVSAWLVEAASDCFATDEAIAIVNGNGSNRPTGLLASSPVTTADDNSPLRAANVLKYEPLLSGSPEMLDADLFIEVATASLKERYLVGPGVAWVMNRTLLSQVRRLKGNDGHYLYSDSLQAGTPGTLSGFPVYTSDSIDVATANNFPAIFGNWRRGYVLTDRVGLRVTLDEITTPGQVRFYVRRRVGGCVRNNDALRALKYAGS